MHNYAYYVHNYANFHILYMQQYLNHFPCDNHLTCDKRALCDRGFPVSLAFGERSEPIASNLINDISTCDSRTKNILQHFMAPSVQGNVIFMAHKSCICGTGN